MKCEVPEYLITASSPGYGGADMQDALIIEFDYFVACQTTVWLLFRREGNAKAARNLRHLAI
jgi:hypothetical protein